jgi:two-component system, OmpR family, phosphate regulon sensor histidine kinase PhoR
MPDRNIGVVINEVGHGMIWSETIMKQTRWFIYPLIVFVLSTVALGISLFLYIYWYVSVSAGLEAVIRRYQLDPSQFFEARTWVVILVLSLLVGIILTGILVIFIYNLRALQLYRLQHTFINNFTHELKTPVTSLKLYLETFVRHELPRAQQLEYIDFMLQDVERLSGNIGSILNLARLESKVHEGEFTEVDLVALVHEFVAENHHLFQDCEIRVEDPPDGKLVAAVVVSLLEMLLMNILTNAIKHNAARTPQVTIDFVPGRKNFQIRFRDNGIGIEQKEIKKIFRKFYQARRRDENARAGGSGIGLHLVWHIARLHGGRIAAESEGAGKGSVFTLTLPR